MDRNGHPDLTYATPMPRTTGLADPADANQAVLTGTMTITEINEDALRALADQPPVLRPGHMVTLPFAPGGDRENMAANALNMLSAVCHTASFDAGWWIDPATGGTRGTVPEKLCLIHSEISEAMEGDRKGLRDDKLPHRWMVEVELADALIRIFDLAGCLGLDLGGAVIEKMAYNAERADHKLENRAAANGKAY